MKKNICILLGLSFVITTGASAQNASSSEELAKMMKEGPKAVQIDTRKLSQKNRPSSFSFGKTNASANTGTPDEDLNQAPFGLAWGAGKAAVEAMGATLSPAKTKIKNSYMATTLPKPIPDFNTVEISFGNGNALDRIISYSTPEEDGPDAGKALFLYRKYYKLLESKYGNAKQVYSPKIVQIETTVDVGRGKTETKVEEVKQEIGNTNFLEELEAGEASLFSTFEGSGVGTVLSVRAEGGKSFIIIDYKSLAIIQKQEKNILDAL